MLGLAEPRYSRFYQEVFQEGEATVILGLLQRQFGPLSPPVGGPTGGAGDCWSLLTRLIWIAG